VSVALTTKNHGASLRRKRRVQVFGRIAYRVSDRTGFAALRWKQPELTEQVEHDGPPVRRKIKAEFSTFPRAYDDGLECGLINCLSYRLRRIYQGKHGQQASESRMREHIFQLWILVRRDVVMSVRKVRVSVRKVKVNASKESASVTLMV
jgi:hypothetical protein